MTSWQDALASVSTQTHLQRVLNRVESLRAQGRDIYPSEEHVFAAFDITSFAQTKVVILGQDPYHGEGQAHGLSFSVPCGKSIPPSLRNIFKELTNDIDGFSMPLDGDLSGWAKQGVLLLNTVLTVEKGQAHSHAKLGWESYTDDVIDVLNKSREHLVFMLWGSHAHKKGQRIDTNKHLVLTAVHPSPLSAYRGFFGCRHFSQANHYLQDNDLTTIDWRL